MFARLKQILHKTTRDTVTPGQSTIAPQQPAAEAPPVSEAEQAPVLDCTLLDAGLEVVERSSYGFFWNLWLCMYWVCKKAVEGTPEAVSHDAAQPPYFPLLDDWTALWGRLISLPEAASMCRALDAALPRSQIIIARKPLE